MREIKSIRNAPCHLLFLIWLLMENLKADAAVDLLSKVKELLMGKSNIDKKWSHSEEEILLR